MKVSIIMPVYNGSLTVARAIDSMISQTFVDWELIIVDDGSRDGTIHILEEIAVREPRILIHRNVKNMGIGASLNLAWKMSRGILVARMDADDYSFPQRIERQVEFMDCNPDISILGTGIQLVNKSNQITGIAFRPQLHETIVSKIYMEIAVFHPTVMMRRSFLDATGGYNEDCRHKSEDLDLWLRAQHRFQFHNLTEVLIQYRMPEKTSFSEVKARICVLIRSAYRDRVLLKNGWHMIRFLIAGVASVIKGAVCASKVSRPKISD